jgi:hypothetical protein
MNALRGADLVARGREFERAIEIAMNALMIGPTVTHPDRDDYGTIVVGGAPAWTPNELTVDAPDVGMVQVRWSDSVDRTQPYWEYAVELRAAAVHGT